MVGVVVELSLKKEMDLVQVLILKKMEEEVGVEAVVEEVVVVQLNLKKEQLEKDELHQDLMDVVVNLYQQID